jgi:hypothetical protein
VRVTVRLTNHRVPPYILTGVGEGTAQTLVDEWRWGVARVIPIPVNDVVVHVARREILSVEVEDDHPDAATP